MHAVSFRMRASNVMWSGEWVCLGPRGQQDVSAAASEKPLVWELKGPGMLGNRVVYIEARKL